MTNAEIDDPLVKCCVDLCCGVFIESAPERRLPEADTDGLVGADENKGPVPLLILSLDRG